jgi:hypothetical protein
MLEKDHGVFWCLCGESVRWKKFRLISEYVLAGYEPVHQGVPVAMSDQVRQNFQ